MLGNSQNPWIHFHISHIYAPRYHLALKMPARQRKVNLDFCFCQSNSAALLIYFSLLLLGRNTTYEANKIEAQGKVDCLNF